MLNKLFDFHNTYDLNKIYNLFSQKGGADNLNHYYAIIGVLLFAAAYTIYNKYIYWPYSKGTVIDKNSETKEYLIKFNIDNNECKRILKNPSNEYEINSKIDIQYNPNSEEINESYEYLYSLNIVIIVTGFIFILIYFSYDLFSTSQNNNNLDSNNLDSNNFNQSNTEIKNLYILRSR